MNSKLIVIPVLTLTAVLAGCVHHRHYATPRTVVARPVPAPLVQPAAYVGEPAPVIVEPAPVIVEPAPIVHSTTYVVEPSRHHHSDPHRRPRTSANHKTPPKPVVAPKPAPKPASKSVRVIDPTPKPVYHHAAPEKIKMPVPSKTVAAPKKSAPKPASKSAPQRK